MYPLQVISIANQRKADTRLTQLETEISAMHRIRHDAALLPSGLHPHIVRLEEFNLNTDASCAMLTMDFVEPGVAEGHSN